VAVVFTLSRMAWLSLVVGVVVIVVNVAGRARRWAVGAVLVASLAMLLHPGVQTRLRWSSVSGINDDRKAIWSVCRAVVSDHPLTGVGWGNFPKRALPYYERLAPPDGMRAWCHDAFFSAWAEGGPVLFGALVAFWVLLLRAFWRGARSGDATGRAAAAGALAALVAMLLNSLVHDIFYSSEAVYGLGFALGIAAALARLARSAATTEPSPAVAAP
jgi:O-antigen ligase